MLHYEVYIFIDIYHSQGRGQVEKAYQRAFPRLLIYDTEEKVVVRFEGEKGQVAFDEITLFQYLDPENGLPIDPSIRFLCVAHPAS